MTARSVARPLLRWTARIVGALLVGLVILLAFGEGVRFQDFDAVSGSMAAVFLVALVGMLFLWRWELVGGIMDLVGMGGFYAIDFLASGDLRAAGCCRYAFCPVCWRSCRGRLRREVNQRWVEATRPIVEAFFHAGYFLEMVCKYGKELEEPPDLLPSGWAAVLYLYGLR